MARSDCFPKLGWCNAACFLLLAITTRLLFVERVAAQNLAAIGFQIPKGSGFSSTETSSDGITYVDVEVPTYVLCFCPESLQVEIFISNTRLMIQQTCVGLSRRTNVTRSGNYTCHFTYQDNQVLDASKYLQLVNLNEDVHVIAPSVQYGIFNSSMTLQCQANSSSIKWKNSLDVEVSRLIESVSFTDEGNYTCEINLGTILLKTTRSVQLVVLAAPKVVSVRPTPDNNQIHFTSNSDESLTVSFMSKNSDDTVIQWYSKGSPLPEGSWTTNTTDPMNSQTSINFRPIRRSDAGEYRVNITNTHPHINSSQRTREVRVQVVVTIQPGTPTGLTFDHTHQQLTWMYNGQTADNVPENQLVRIAFSTGSSVLQRAVDGAARHVLLPILIPASMYTAEVIGFNQDGNATSELYHFQTSPAAPSVSSVLVQRADNATIIITAHLYYTGGPTITSFIVSYRSIGTYEWSVARVIPVQRGSTDLEWRATITDGSFLHSMIELQVAILNSNNFNTSGIYREHVDVPGAPKAVSVVTSDYNSVTLRISLSDNGATPLLTVEVYFQSDHQGNQTSNVTADSTSLVPGNDVDVVVPDLVDGTEYSMTVAIYNYGGIGTPSHMITARTLTRPPLPVYGIALLVVAVGILVVAMVLLVVMAFKKSADHKKRQRAYSVTMDGGKTKALSPSHPVLKCAGNKCTSTPTSPSPPTPSTATSILTSPPAFYPPPGFPRNGAPSGGHSSFKFDSGSSRSTSVNQDGSDTSDSTSPRYIYTFPRSGEVTPHIPHAPDKKDGLRDHTPFMPMRELDGMCMMNHDMLPSAASRSRLGSADTSRSRLTGTSGLGSSSPYLQSTYSVNTVATRLTCDSMSTQDGLIFARIESNRTDV